MNKILVIEDDKIIRHIIVDILKYESYQTFDTNNGKTGIELALQHLPDLIVCDIMMPQMSGYDVLKTLRENTLTATIPFIFMTAKADHDSIRQGMELGADDYLTKPFKNKELVGAISSRLKKKAIVNQQIQQKIDELRYNLAEQAALLNITTDAIIVQDLSNHILFWNKGAEKIYGWLPDETLGKNALQILYKPGSNQLEITQQTISTIGEWQGELYQITKAGVEVIVASRWVLMRDQQGQPKSILTVSTDITEKKQLENQFFRAQRLESLGILAGGIAHDLNNVLTPIMMSVQLLQSKISDVQSIKWLTILEINVKRGADLVQQVLSFARGMQGERALIQINHLINELKQFASETFPKSIRIYTNVKSSLEAIVGDATQLHQVLLNLCVNARDAMQEGGTLTIDAENIYLDEHYTRMNIDAHVGNYIVITVSDTGIGIPNDIMEKIFDPFFTTKEVGQGTGLGLSTVIGIVKSHGGFVKVKSEVGKGTQFKVYLPATGTTATSEDSNLSQLVQQGQGELILIVEDEDSIREITKTLLEKNGYQAITANDGMDAIALYTQYNFKFDAVILDIMMPSMDGLTTIRVLEKINPQVQIIAVSGLTSNKKVMELKSSCVKAFLPKPYTSNELLEQLHQVLSKPKTLV
ncbi:multi-sensor hybrid histidine kinase [Crinalium epipsammum PCC 9333]|uniref:histidine kinase n=1 Tax=Crinalium epipsammum PCC 9333 TaxID=1173022 RepID=K9W2R6_9CYAN|nr:response regulator [Crinalium epipsammum]AFZ14516.1 multi-sensor hybrid histidine kinase [Crinalium epipsammum PCC 9333]